MIGGMLWIDREDVGHAALARMLRDGTVTPLSDNACAVPEAAPVHVARAHALAPCVPRRAAATGLAALWCYGLAAHMPLTIGVAVPRGAHPDPPPAAVHRRWEFTTNQVAYARSRIIAGVRLVRPADAVAAALGAGDLAHAVSAAYRALATGVANADELCEALQRPRPRHERQRAASAWQAVQEALSGR